MDDGRWTMDDLSSQAQSQPSFEHLLISHPAPKICKITLNRPKQFNALARQTLQEMHSALSLFENSTDDVLILTGSGRAFCFGADFTEFDKPEILPIMLQSFQDVILRLYHCSKMTIASLNGFATGAGLDLALACDFRLASENAKIGEAYIGMGLVPDGGGSFFLTQLLGISGAMKMLVSGESIPAQEARALGLLQEVTSSEELPARTLQFAESLREKPQTALRQIKKLVKANASSDLKASLERERTAQHVCFEDETHQAIVREFLAKRKDRKRTE